MYNCTYLFQEQPLIFIYTILTVHNYTTDHNLIINVLIMDLVMYSKYSCKRTCVNTHAYIVSQKKKELESRTKLTLNNKKRLYTVLIALILTYGIEY